MKKIDDQKKSSPFISLNGVSKFIFESDGKKKFLLRDINLEVKMDSFIIINGDSGAGKTTLVNVMGGLSSFQEGTITFENQIFSPENFSEYSKKIRSDSGFIFQDYWLLDSLTVFENVELASLFSHSNNRKENFRWMSIEEVLKFVDILHLKDRYPENLSGGEKQRVAIARSLIRKPKVIFCDEPTASLHSKIELKIINLLKEVNKKFGVIIVMVTHKETLKRIADHLVTLWDGRLAEEQLVKIFQ